MSANDAELLAAHLPALHVATSAAAADIVARATDGSFLERTLRDGLAAQLPGSGTEQPLGLDRSVWAGRLGGVDVLYVDETMRIGVETKVWDVRDSLYDLLKLAAGTQRKTIAIGFCVIAGRARDWRAASAVREISRAPSGATVEWTTADLLRDHSADWARIWTRTAIRPAEVLARLRTVTGEPITMPQVPDHVIELIGLQAVGGERLGLDGAGSIR